MNCAPQQAIRPVAQKVADVDQDRRGGVILGAGGKHGHGGPGAGGCQDLETGLRGALEEEGEGTVVGVGAGADVDVGTIIRGCGEGWIVQISQYGPGWTQVTGVPRGQPRWWRGAEAEAEEGKEFETHGAAGLEEV